MNARPSNEVDAGVVDQIANLPDDVFGAFDDEGGVVEPQDPPEETEKAEAPPPADQETQEASEEGEGKEDAEAEDKEATDEDDESKEEEAPSEDEGDFIEYLNDATGETEKVSVTEALESHRKYHQLSGDLASYQSQLHGKFVEQYAPVLQEQLDLREQWVERAEKILEWSPVGDRPSTALLDESSEHFSPHEYQRQLANWEDRKARWDAFQGEVSKEKEALEADRQKVAEATASREAEALLRIWPEWGQPEKAVKLKTDVMETLSHYGFTPAEADQLADHRMFGVLKDAMAYRAMKAGKGETVKKKAAPKLVKSKGKAAGTQQLHGAAKSSHARKQLKKSGDIRDAAAALESIL